MSTRAPTTRCTPPAMLAPEIPIDEPARLAALHRLKLLDTPPEEQFDLITRLAAKALGVPTVLISLVDADRQWFKSRVGLDATETAREISFCGHAIFQRRTLVVPDATRDARFAGNPLVTGAPSIRAYLGVPVFTPDCQPVGTLCAIDRLPRQFSAEEIATLGEFAAFLEEMLRCRDLSGQAKEVLNYAAERERLFRDAFDQAPVGLIHSGLSGQIQRVNQRACDILGLGRTQCHAVTILDFVHPQEHARHDQLFKNLTAGLIRDYRVATKLRTGNGRELAVLLSVAAKLDPDGHAEHLIASFDDVSELAPLATAAAPAREAGSAGRAAQRKRGALAAVIPAMIATWKSLFRR